MSDDKDARTNARVLGADAKTGSTMRAALASVATERRISLWRSRLELR